MARQCAQFIKIALAPGETKLGDVEANVQRITETWRSVDSAGISLLATPELSLTGYSIRDALHQADILNAVDVGLNRLCELSRSLSSILIVGFPFRVQGLLYNCAGVIQHGELKGIAPKLALPTDREFEERRHFSEGEHDITFIQTMHGEVPFGAGQIFQDGDADFQFGIELCEDAWVTDAPHGELYAAGADLVINLSASNYTLGKAKKRRVLCEAASLRGSGAYAYLSAGLGESTTDVAFDGHVIYAERGQTVLESTRFPTTPIVTVTDIDLAPIRAERLRRNHNRSLYPFYTSPIEVVPLDKPHRHFSRTPFTEIACDDDALWESFEIQSYGLANRMAALGKPKIILGVSGGLDSTHAALVAIEALQRRGQPRSDLIAVGMPGLGSSTETQNNAQVLAEELGASFIERPISEATYRELKAIKHRSVQENDSFESWQATLSKEDADITFENVQARLRTLTLMSLANQLSGFVLGTGDLSEKALGWSTYAGDQTSHYDVNAGVPKTLIKHLISWVATHKAKAWIDGSTARFSEVLTDILGTPISPELVPSTLAGGIQRTESVVGDFDLNDFFLYHWIGEGRMLSSVLTIATESFSPEMTREEVKAALHSFVRRFVSQQFKRSATPDGPKVLGLSLSPRGDWRFPSDMGVEHYLKEI